MIGNENHGTLPIFHGAQGVDQAVQEEVCIADGIVVGIDDVVWLVYLECLGVFVDILWTVTGAGVQDDQYLVLGT